MSDLKGPNCVGIIMDGNRRFAKAKGLSSLEGHEAGEKNLFTFLDEYGALREKWGAAHYIFYAFSTENWNRSHEEVAHLLGIFERAFLRIEERLPKLLEDGVSVRFIGEQGKFSAKLQKLMSDIEAKTMAGKEGTIAIAVSYGGRADVLQAVNGLIEKDREVISEEDVKSALWTRGIPEPDLIIRTGGEKRLSNFLLFEAAYAELFFTDTMWPDFNKEELEQIFTDFASRERRRGR